MLKQKSKEIIIKIKQKKLTSDLDNFFLVEALELYLIRMMMMIAMRLAVMKFAFLHEEVAVEKQFVQNSTTHLNEFLHWMCYYCDYI